MTVTLDGYGQSLQHGDDIREAVKRYGQAEVIISYPGFDLMTQIAARFSVASCNGTEAVLSLSHIDAEDFITTGREYKLILPEPRKGFFTASSVAEAMLWQSYPTWKHYDTIMHKIAEHWPEVCMLDTIGYSVQGRAVLAMKISDNPTLEEKEPAVMLSSTIHGDEPAGFVLLMRLAEYLASESTSGGLASDLVTGLEIWINPLANPDGMYRDNDTMINPVRANSYGYDLNRNFPDPEVTFSPPLQRETLAMMAFLDEKRFALSVNLHSGAEVVNYPWDKWTRLHADDEWFNDISRRYADTVHLYSEPGYMSFLDNGVTRGWEWYIVRGGRQDFVTWGLGGREVTIEIDDTKMTLGSNLETLWNWNHRSLIRYMAEALNGVSGTVADATTGEPLRARIFIEGHDIDSSHIWSDSLTGEYYRFIAPGTYSITFSSPGYVSYSFEAVIDGWNSPVAKDVQLQKPADLYPVPPETGLLIWPVPSGGPLSIMLPSSITGEVTVTMTTTSGSVLKSFRTTAYPGIPVVCDCNNLPTGLLIVSVRKEPDGPLLRGKAVIARLK
ncbi:MAG: hypothetical protein LC630_04870 [Bacteroidales bacterium]|nr:hypothetical protein [Bacteroidales bacterium]